MQIEKDDERETVTHWRSILMEYDESLADNMSVITEASAEVLLREHEEHIAHEWNEHRNAGWQTW